MAVEHFTHFTVCYCCSVPFPTMTMTLKVFGNFLDNCMDASWSKQCRRKSNYHSRDLRHFHSGSHHSVCNGGSEVSRVTAGDTEKKRKQRVGGKRKARKQEKIDDSRANAGTLILKSLSSKEADKKRFF